MARRNKQAKVRLEGLDAESTLKSGGNGSRDAKKAAAKRNNFSSEFGERKLGVVESKKQSRSGSNGNHSPSIAKTILATNLRYPKSPVWLSDNSVLVVEAERKTLSRVSDNRVEVVSQLKGCPTSVAIGPSGKAFVCNSGSISWTEVDGLTVPGLQGRDYTGGKIEIIDLLSGESETLYDEANGTMLRAPSNIVFDSDGGFWFTDSGKVRARQRDQGGLYYAKADGSQITEVVYPLDSPTGIGLSIDESTLYVAESRQGRVLKWPLEAPGKISAYFGPLHRGELLADPEGGPFFESLAIDTLGNVCVATAGIGITTITPEGAYTQSGLQDAMVTGVAFGGKDWRQMLATLSGVGNLISQPWHVAGKPPKHVL